MIFAKWKGFFCKTTVARPFWAICTVDPTVERDQRLCLGVQLICGKLKNFLKVWGLRVGCIEV
jgi:hypothetical protein